MCEASQVSLALPSMRARTLTGEIAALISKVRKTGFTIAPEAGTQRLRNVINKGISETDILQTVEEAFTEGDAPVHGTESDPAESQPPERNAPSEDEPGESVSPEQSPEDEAPGKQE